jgi:carboxylate-amine ligase
VRTVGVEEELLLVDGASGRPLSVAARVLARAHAREQASADGDDTAPTSEGRRDEPGGVLEGELQLQQLETDTHPTTDLAELERELRAWRHRAVVASRDVGARVAALGTSPLPVEPRPAASPRYRRMVERFGLTTMEQLVCGCHVHVSVDSDDEAVAVLERIRVWLPCLLAISANSPFWQGTDTGYASFRSQVMTRWPASGPPPVLGTAEAYRTLVTDMVESGVLLDEAMVYFDARVSFRYPTVEIRAADVCLDAGDAVLVAALCRGLVETAARQWRSGEPAPQVPTALLRLASWQAGREGVRGSLLDPLTSRPYPAEQVLHRLVAHVRPVLQQSGDDGLVDQRLAEVLRRGAGAQRQREVHARTGQLVDVIADAANVTAAQA